MLAVTLNQHRVSSLKTVRLRAPCDARCIGHAIRTWSAFCLHLQFGKGARAYLCMDEIELPNTSPQEFKLDPISCLGQAHSNRRGTSSRYENTECRCILAVLPVPSLIRPLRSPDAKSGKIFKKILRS